MNAERLLDHYHRIADAPDAIARLRRFILDLAVRGKLVPQDPNDEPASELLKRIGREKARLVKAGEIRTPKPIPALFEPPFPIPTNWRWSQIAEIGVLSPRNEAPDARDASFVPMPLIAAEYGVANEHEIRPWGEIKKGYTHFAEGDVGLAKITPCFENGKSTIFRNLTGGIGSGTTELHIVRPLFVDQDYILLFFKSPHFIETGIPKMTGTAGQKRVPTEYFAHSPFPLPPLAEQRRIVAKVDELMALCDRLEAARAGREAMRDRLGLAALARLNAPKAGPRRPETPAQPFANVLLRTSSAMKGVDLRRGTHSAAAADGEDSFADQARFVLDNLEALTTRPDQIRHLRQTILNLAVRGKLVPQDPNDEPAAELLKEISETRKKLYSEKQIPKPKELPSIDEFDLPFLSPSGWAWSVLGELCYQVSDGPHFSPQYVAPEQGIPFLSTRNIRPNGFDLGTIKYVSRADHEEFCKRIRPEKGDIIYTKGGTTGIAKVNDLDFEFSVWVHLAVLQIEKKRLYPRYVEMALNSPHCYEQSQRYTQGTSNFDLGLTRMIKITIPLPPLAEQRRIVAKVDALMALCDRLEARLDATAATRRRLLDALLAEALSTGTSAPAETRERAAAE